VKTVIKIKTPENLYSVEITIQTSCVSDRNQSIAVENLVRISTAINIMEAGGVDGNTFDIPAMDYDAGLASGLFNVLPCMYITITKL